VWSVSSCAVVGALAEALSVCQSRKVQPYSAIMTTQWLDFKVKKESVVQAACVCAQSMQCQGAEHGADVECKNKK